MFIAEYVIADEDLDDMGLKHIAHQPSLYSGWLGNSIEELHNNELNNKPLEVACTLYTDIIDNKKYITKAEYYDIGHDNVSYNYFYPKEVDL